MAKKTQFLCFALAICPGGGAALLRERHVAERDGIIGRSDAWKDATGSFESFPFRVEGGKGFVYEGVNCDDPCNPVVSRPDWTVEKGGRTFLLYEIDPGNMEKTGFYSHSWDSGGHEAVPLYNESLWIGLVDADHKVVRKIRLASGVQDISGIRRGKGASLSVSTTDVQGKATNIVLQFPEPWPPLETTGDPWEDCKLREQRLWDELWEDWPGNGSGYAADWVSKRFDERIGAEYDRAIEALKRLAPSEERRAELDAERHFASTLAWEVSGDSHMTAANVHWGNFTDRVVRQKAQETFLRNWLQGAAHPEEYERIRAVRGSFQGREFATRNGIGVLPPPGGWPEKKSGEESGNGEGNEDGEESGCGAEEDSGVYVELVRLAPERCSREGDDWVVGFDLIRPWVMDSGWLAGEGTFLLRDGVLAERSYEPDY
ncbi:MAG: hypothetical protein IJS32_10520 [Kiritimatiellae bacterium]|nr:hypothetical protein [Kiritimatiellia bacterium]